MKKIFSIALIALLFCSSIFAETFVVIETNGSVKYESAPGIWKELKKGDKVTKETKINVPINSLLGLKGENGKEYNIGTLRESLKIPIDQKLPPAEKATINW